MIAETKADVAERMKKAIVILVSLLFVSMVSFVLHNLLSALLGFEDVIFFFLTISVTRSQIL